MTTRMLGRSGIEVSAVGFGCWAIGGPMVDAAGTAVGWGEVDDAESVRAIRRALELGVTFFDTADVYGGGHSERILGEALGSDRGSVAVATKFGNTFEGRHGLTPDASPDYMRRACEASLARLGTEHIDLYQLHLGELPAGVDEPIADALDELVDEGLIRAYAWSTDNPECAARWLGRDGYVAVQHILNVFEDRPAMLALCEANGLAGIIRSPLAGGFLSGKYRPGVRVAQDDWRAAQRDWNTFFTAEGDPEPAWLERLDAIREILTSGGRTVGQGAIGWLWARSPGTVPIPGCRTVAQVEDNAGALAHGALSPAQLAEIDEVLGR